MFRVSNREEGDLYLGLEEPQLSKLKLDCQTPNNHGRGPGKEFDCWWTPNTVLQSRRGGLKTQPRVRSCVITCLEKVVKKLMM